MKNRHACLAVLHTLHGTRFMKHLIGDHDISALGVDKIGAPISSYALKPLFLANLKPHAVSQDYMGARKNGSHRRAHALILVDKGSRVANAHGGQQWRYARRKQKTALVGVLMIRPAQGSLYLPKEKAPGTLRLRTKL